MKEYENFEHLSKNQAYWERNQLVCALSKIFPSWLEKHPESDNSWDKEWMTIVFIEFPGEKQASWHLHDDDITYFTHCEFRDGNSFDGHSSSEKYRRIRSMKVSRDL